MKFDDHTVPTAEKSKPAADRLPAAHRRAEWIRYMSKKRMFEQLLQVHMLHGLNVETVLEIGPYMGAVTAMLDNAGFGVTTLDMTARRFDRPDCPHIVMDLTEIDPARLRGFDLIMCCATLEHIQFDEAERALEAFKASGAPYILLSLPYSAMTLYFEIYLNRFRLFKHFQWRKLRFAKTFKSDPINDPRGHKWEIGYRGFSLKMFENLLTGMGFEVLRREFSFPSNAVFHLLRNPQIDAPKQSD